MMYIDELGEKFYGLFEKDSEGKSGREAVARYFGYKDIGHCAKIIFATAEYSCEVEAEYSYDSDGYIDVKHYFGSHYILYYNIYSCRLYISEDDYHEQIRDWNSPEPDVREIDVSLNNSIYIPDIEFYSYVYDARLSIFRKRELKYSRFWFMEGH